MAYYKPKKRRSYKSRSRVSPIEFRARKDAKKAYYASKKRGYAIRKLKRTLSF